MNESPTQNALGECIRVHLPQAESVSFTPIRSGRFNTSYFVQAGAEELVLRIAPPDDAGLLFYERKMMRQEPALHRKLREKTTLPVPEILVQDFTRRLLPRDFLIMRRLTGIPLSEAPQEVTDGVLFQTGRALAELHEIQEDLYGYLGPHVPMPPESTWAEAFTVMWGKLLDDIVATGHYTPEEGAGLKQMLADHRAAFERDVPASLLHMDIWAQNLLVNDAGDLSGILDWDRALYGDPEIEFAVLDYCGISQTPFWEGYGKPRDTSPDAALRHLFYTLYELQKYIVIRHARHADAAGAGQYKQQAFELLREAFQR